MGVLGLQVASRAPAGPRGCGATRVRGGEAERLGSRARKPGAICPSVSPSFILLIRSTSGCQTGLSRCTRPRAGLTCSRSSPRHLPGATASALRPLSRLGARGRCTRGQHARFLGSEALHKLVVFFFSFLRGGGQPSQVSARYAAQVARVRTGGRGQKPFGVARESGGGRGAAARVEMYRRRPERRVRARGATAGGVALVYLLPTLPVRVPLWGVL